jgi:hypothetical protein
LTSATEQPLCVHVAENAFTSDPAGRVTTTFCSLKTLPPPSGISSAFPSGPPPPPPSVLSSPEPSSPPEPQAARVTAAEAAPAAASTDLRVVDAVMETSCSVVA